MNNRIKIQIIILGGTVLAVLPLTFIGCTKEAALNKYHSAVETIGALELTASNLLKGEREEGLDSYVGTYHALYEDFSGTEMLFGGTSAREREDGDELTVTCELTIESGKAEVFFISGDEEKQVLVNTEEKKQVSVTLPTASNYIGVSGKYFSGELKLRVE